jgi:hypothetical protein
MSEWISNSLYRLPTKPAYNPFNGVTVYSGSCSMPAGAFYNWIIDGGERDYKYNFVCENCHTPWQDNWRSCGNCGHYEVIDL